MCTAGASGTSQRSRRSCISPARLSGCSSPSPPSASRSGCSIRSRFTEAAPRAELELRQVGWEDSTAGLADQSSDIAFVWLPLPAQGRYEWTVVAEEPCLAALAETDPRASDPELAFEDLLDEPFLALPESAGPLRDYWLANDQRGGKPPVVGAIITSPDETYEALVDGRGICLIAEGNAPSLMRGGVVTRPVHGVPSCTLALAWRAGDTNPLRRAYADAATQVVQHLDRTQLA